MYCWWCESVDTVPCVGQECENRCKDLLTHHAPDAPVPPCSASSDGWEEADEADTSAHAATCAREQIGGPLAAGRPHTHGRPAPPSVDVRACDACQPQQCVGHPCGRMLADIALRLQPQSEMLAAG